MSEGARGDPALGPDLFLDVCGATPQPQPSASAADQQHVSSYTGYQFEPWTSPDHFMAGYTQLLQGQAQTPGAAAPQQGQQQSASQSSQASATEASASASLAPSIGTGVGPSGSGGQGQGSTEQGSGLGGWFRSTREKVKRWKNRTPVQHEANKAAQRRYRERKKGQVAELQAQADTLAAKVESLQVVERENAALEASNSALEQQLSATHSPTTSADSKPASSGSTASGWQTFNDQFLHVVEELEAFLRARQVAPSPSDEGTPPETVAEINGRMLQAMDKCMTALNLGGLKLQSLIDAVETRVQLRSHAGQEGQRGCYNAAQQLALAPEQIRRGLQYRAHIIGVLDRIYGEREALNARVAAALQSEGGAATAPDLAPALTKLKANLAAEMRAVSEEHFLLLRLLLSPTQGAWLLVQSFPMHCDCLAFFNGLHAAYGGGAP